MYLGVLAGIFLISVEMLSAKPLAIYLSWKGDPTSTMVVQWLDKERVADRVLYYAELGQEEMIPVRSFSGSLRKGTAKRQWAEIEGLKPDSEYRFWLIKANGKAQGPYRFRTLPKTLTREVRFAIGGDAYCSYKRFRKMNAVVAKQNPQFVVLGGDIAYAFDYMQRFTGSNGDWNRWKTFFESWTEQMVDEEGRLIPLIPVVGNHDVKGNYLKYSKGITPRPLFYDLFLFPEDMRAYRTLTAGEYLTLFLLDSGHTRRIEDEQKVWLEHEIGLHQQSTYKLAAYHVPAYPGLNQYERPTALRIRNSWVELFEKGGVQAAFEHHGHVYKRSVPIRGGKEDPTGVLYLGDGSWGTHPRKPEEPSKLWYLAKSASINAAFIVDIAPEKCTIRAIDATGQFFDETQIAPRSQNVD